MEAAIPLLNEMVTRGLLDSYAIGGAMASLFYAEPVATFDLDVFVLLPTAHSDRTIVTLEPQIAFLREHGAVQEGEHVVIQGLPVQILPRPEPHVPAGMLNSPRMKCDGGGWLRERAEPP